jgi:negative regulator of sigma-B (phosphoserine phosphatase)
VIISAAQVSSPMPGELQNGDAALIRTSATGDTILAVIDGLGHGPDAAHASRKAIEVLTLMPFQQSVLEAMQEMHQELRGTRGAAATLCIIRDFKLEICAVGNVALMCTGCAVPLVLSPGVLGHQVSRFRVGACEVRHGCRLALLSDGISTRFRLEEYKQLEPARACAEIMSRYRRKEDDASILVADVRASA